MEIELNGKRGGVALVDEEDYEPLSKYSWHKNKDGYVRGDIDGQMILMHKFIMKVGKNNNKFVDHINRKPYDNR